MSIKLYSYALLVFALSSFVMAAPPLVQPAPTPERMSQWLPLLYYPHINDLGQTWVRVERDPLSAEGKKRNLDDVITFKVGPIPNHPALTGVTEIWRSTVIRFLTPEKKTDPEQCGERNGEIPHLRRFQPAPISDGNSILLGTWAITEHFNPSGTLSFSSETPIIEIQNRDGKLQMRHLPLKEKQGNFAMARTCDVMSGAPVFVKQLVFKHPFTLAEGHDPVSGSRRLVPMSASSGSM